MKTLDRYIARLYLTNVLALLVILSCFVVTIDFSLNVDRFVGRAKELVREHEQEPSGLRTGVITLLLIADLWWPRLLQLFSFVLGLVMTGAMGFTLSQLVRHRELVAVLASGQSLRRVAMPILAVAIGLTGLQVLNQELVLPRLAPLLTRDQGDAGTHQLGAAHVPLTRDGLGRVWYARSFDADQGTLQGVYVWERDAQGKPTARYYAEGASWSGDGWSLIGGVVQPAADSAGSPQPISHLKTNLDPTQLRVRRFQSYSQNLSWRQIGEMVAAVDALDPGSGRTAADKARLERIRWGRVSMILASLLALTISMPFFLRKEPGSAVVRALRCAPVAIVALMGGVLGASAPIPGVPPQVGVFLPVLILLPVAFASVASIRT
ncbi:MAG TPA: LptF/LptG family permease [Phycisphaerales bacterium]|nr:LptF/LptG family permease [Phycisphaerales bacterium]